MDSGIKVIKDKPDFINIISNVIQYFRKAKEETASQ